MQAGAGSFRGSACTRHARRLFLGSVSPLCVCVCACLHDCKHVLLHVLSHVHKSVFRLDLFIFVCDIYLAQLDYYRLCCVSQI